MNHQIRFKSLFFILYFAFPGWPFLGLCIGDSAMNASTIQNILTKGRNLWGREFSYVVSIRKNGIYNCGGAIIDEWTILTAAHCVDRSIKANVIRQLTVVTGTDQMYQGGTIHKVCRGTFYPGYERDKVGSKPDDIAVITLCKPIIFNKYQNKINLPSSDFIDNTTAVVAGWGYENYEEKELSCSIQKFTPKIVHSDYCRPYGYYKLNKGHLCAIHKATQGPCRGISGSPLVVKREIIGIVSWGPPRCSTGDPEVYTNVFQYLDFITLVKNNLVFY
ncbi:chymotrypsin-1-like isoform X1 [Leptopilina boulardi]|uniref:chymotrypsin-1-like isoform X1 n=1 Tax=Leptopilina boulardi TaxID=63433 RepID=UPI0021F5B2EA|nr:chymotrypsin-1-like isoform X1 [Leptopilina boulardi]